MYLFHIYSSDILQKREFDLCVANSKKQRKYEPLFIYTFLFYSSAARWVAFFWSRRVALWTGRQLFKPRTKVQALLLASIRLTAKKKAKKKSRIPASWYLSFSSDLPARGQAEYTHNDQWKIRLLFNFCYWESRFVTLSLCLLFFFSFNPCGIFVMSPEQNFDLSPSEGFTV